jgi:hypothetical protein
MITLLEILCCVKKAARARPDMDGVFVNRDAERVHRKGVVANTLVSQIVRRSSR